ncbi:MAG: sulfite exporter TauE/SafE family protein [Planctomycetota bacterium]
MNLLEFALLAATGLFCGVINTLAGGGSLIAVPLLIFLGIPPTVANATNRPALVAQNIAAVAGFWRGGIFADAEFRRQLVFIGMMALPGAALGAAMGYLLHSDVRGDEVFQALIACILVVVALRPLWQGFRAVRRRSAAISSQTDSPAWLRGLLFFALGVYMGFIQAGIGFVFMAVLSSRLAWPIARINAAKVTIVGACNLVAMVIYALTISINWKAAGALVLGQTLGGYLGSRISLGAAEIVLKRIYVGLLLAFALALVARAFS